jgi:diaminohydroxyphosphoribosylaminopyrimidine deaminase/5-amino-6-(5-phosphoribosylamino)uracil reductase
MSENLQIHEKYMQRCIQLAKNGLGTTYPNPIVGSVVVYENKIIGEGWHKKSGEAHAEVIAVSSVKNKDLLKESTLYVSLEPCAHVGKTPACSTMIIQNKIPNVVIGCTDSSDKVNGKGINMLTNAGVNVTYGILEPECINLNKRFFTFHEKKRPYIVLKWARTIDGFIDLIREPLMPIQPNRITDEYAGMLVHKRRTQEQAIMVATETAQKDNPRLNVRDWSGIHPIRIVLDRTLKLNENLHLLDDTQPTIVFTEKKIKSKINTNYIQISFGNNFYNEFFQVLYNKGIQSVFVEGGAKFLQNLIDNNFWDEAEEYIGNIKFIKGVDAPKILKNPEYTESFSENKRLTYINSNFH